MAADILTTMAQWSTTEGSNLPTGSTSISTNLDDNFRMIQSVVRYTMASDTIASATTCDLGTKESQYLTVSGTTTITGLGTISAGITKYVIFSGALTLTHNATSLILPGAANITTAAGDTGRFLSLGSGNWRCLNYTRASGQALVASTFTIPDGTVSAPGMYFASDTDNGVYRIGANNWAMSVGGGKVVDLTTAGAAVTGTLSASTSISAGTLFRSAISSVSAPAYSFTADTDTGIYSSTANTLDFAIGGVNKFSLDTSLCTLPVRLYMDVGSDQLYQGQTSSGSNNIFLITTSAAAYSNNIAKITTSGTAAGTGFSFFQCDASGSNTVFKVRGDGQVSSDAGTTITTPADYAEMFEWADGNPNNEDRVGCSVALQGEKIRLATAGDVIIGVVSGNPAIVGDAGQMHWNEKYLRDDFNRYIYDGTTRVINPDFDSSQEYTPRESRKEWAAVGLMGKLRLRAGQVVSARWVKMRDISATVSEWLVI